MATYQRSVITKSASVEAIQFSGSNFAALKSWAIALGIANLPTLFQDMVDIKDYLFIELPDEPGKVQKFEAGNWLIYDSLAEQFSVLPNYKMIVVFDIA